MINVNAVSLIIEAALNVKKVNLKPNQNLIRFFPRDPILNMQNIVNGKEIQASQYQLFFENFNEFLNQEFLNKEPSKQAYHGQKFRDIVSEDTNLSLEQEGFILDKITKKKQNAIYFNILIRLTNSSFEKLTVSKVLQIFNAIDLFLSKPDFFQSDVLTKMNAIYYSLTHVEPFETAEMLGKLNDFDLLTEDNLNKINANRKLDTTINFFADVLTRLSLSGGTNSLLTQANLDKLLDNPELNLEILAKFTYADDESKTLTQEKFDLAINLKNLLTQENINKIEKADLDHAKLADIFGAFVVSNILTQENFDQVIQFSKTNFETIYLAISLLFAEDPNRNLLTQENVDKILGQTAFDTNKLASVFNFFDEVNILSRDNFRFIDCTKDEFEENIFPVLSIMHEKKILNQNNLDVFFIAYYQACISDEEGRSVKISKLDLENFLIKNFGINFNEIKNNINFNNQSASMAKRLCVALVDFLSRVGNSFQEFFNEILNYFNEKTEKKEVDNIVSKQSITNDSGLNSKASLFGNSSGAKNNNKNPELPSLTNSLQIQLPKRQ